MLFRSIAMTGSISGGFSTTATITCNGGHGNARMQLNYQHSASDSGNSGTLTGWVSEPGITYNSAGIGGNINVSGQYYGRAYNSGYGCYVRFDKGNGNLEHWTTTATAGSAGGQGTRRWFNDASGNSYATSSSRAPIFYDSDNTGYYGDFSSNSNINSLTTAGYIQANSTINLKDRITLPASGLSSASGRPAYAIYQEGGAWSHPYPDLCLAMHTGIKLGANASYNGIRFYTDYDMSVQVMAVNDSSSPIGAGDRKSVV